MAIDLSKYLGGTPGTWNVFGAQLPDYGLTEAAALGGRGLLPQTPQYVNPAVSATMFPSTAPQQTPQPPSTSVSNPWVAPSLTAPQPAGDSPIRQMEKIGWENMNPVQRSQYLSMIGQQSQISAGPNEADFARIYDPAFASLSQQEQLLQSQLPGALESVEGQYALAGKEMEGNRAEQLAALGRQETGVGTGKTNALAQARQLYSELAQQYGARFGSRTSAGPFAMELLGRETQRQFGNIRTGEQGAMSAINDERNRVTDFINTQKEKFSFAKADALREINNTFRNRLAEIGTQRNALESAKSTARYNALLEAQKASQAVVDTQAAFDNKISEMQTEYDLKLRNELATAKTTAASGYDTKYLDSIKKVNDILATYGPETAKQAATAAGVNFDFTPSKGNEWYLDPLTGKYIQKKTEEEPTTFKWPWQ